MPWVRHHLPQGSGCRWIWVGTLPTEGQILIPALSFWATFGWVLIRHSDIEPIFWGVCTEENSLPHRILPVLCETIKNGALFPPECKSPSPVAGSAGLAAPAFGTEASPAVLGASEPGESGVFYWSGAFGLGLYSVTENWFSKLFILLFCSIGLAGMFYQRRAWTWTHLPH